MRGATAFIVLFVIVQFALPVHYYTARADKNDERFAWRMFSTTRMLRCKPAFFIGEADKPVPLAGEFHQAWITTARRGRMEVIEAMGRFLCRKHPGQKVRFELSCEGIHDYTRNSSRWNVCND